MADSKLSALAATTGLLNGTDLIYVDQAGTSKSALMSDVAAYMGDSIQNQSTADQVVTAATLTYLTGSTIAVPAGKLRVGTVLRWRISLSKSAAGTAANAFHFRLGTAGSTADAAILTFTTGVGTAAVDQGEIDLQVVIRGPLTATCIAVGLFNFSHNLAATGHLIIPNAVIAVTSSAFDATTASLKAGVSVTSGASVAYTVQQVFGEAKNL